MKINNWSITGSADPYKAPEQVRRCLRGVVDNHPCLGKEKSITTSSIKNVSGRIVYTSSRSIYQLGKIDPGYRKFLKKIRPNWNWRNPITIL